MDRWASDDEGRSLLISGFFPDISTTLGHRGQKKILNNINGLNFTLNPVESGLSQSTSVIQPVDLYGETPRPCPKQRQIRAHGTLPAARFDIRAECLNRLGGETL